ARSSFGSGHWFGFPVSHPAFPRPRLSLICPSPPLTIQSNMIHRRQTRQVTVGDAAHGIVRIGGDAPVSVQSMTAGYTHEIDKCVAEIHKLAAAGADLVRVAVPERKDTLALKEILPQVSVPIVADVHF